MIGSGIEECFPWAEPLAIKAGLNVLDISTDKRLDATRFTITSLLDRRPVGTVLNGCQMPRTIPHPPFSGLDYIFLPIGPWFLSYELEGYYSGVTLEVSASMIFAEVCHALLVQSINTQTQHTRSHTRKDVHTKTHKSLPFHMLWMAACTDRQTQRL